MLLARLFALFVTLAIALSWLGGRPRRTSRRSLRSAPSVTNRTAADIPHTNPADFWFQTVCRIVWGLIFVGLSLFGALAAAGGLGV